MVSVLSLLPLLPTEELQGHLLEVQMAMVTDREEQVLVLPAGRIYANSGATAAAVRPFSNPLNPGATLSFGFDNGFIDNGGTVGFGIQNSSGQNLVEYYYIGGDGVDAYKKNDNGGQANGSLGFTDDGLTVVFTRTGVSTYSLSVIRLSGGSETLSGTMKNPGGGQVPAQIRFFNFNAGGGGQRNAYYNNLAIANSSTFSGTGNWTDAARWSCGVPATGDAITIAAGANATLEYRLYRSRQLTNDSYQHTNGKPNTYISHQWHSRFCRPVCNVLIRWNRHRITWPGKRHFEWRY